MAPISLAMLVWKYTKDKNVEKYTHLIKRWWYYPLLLALMMLPPPIVLMMLPPRSSTVDDAPSPCTDGIDGCNLTLFNNRLQIKYEHFKASMLFLQNNINHSNCLLNNCWYMNKSKYNIKNMCYIYYSKISIFQQSIWVCLVFITSGITKCSLTNALWWMWDKSGYISGYWKIICLSFML